MPAAVEVPGPYDSRVTIARRTESGDIASAICPYLLAEDGAWRAARPLRDHRCTAVAPAAAPSLEKQRRLCLTADHVICPAYVLAREVVAERRGVPVGDLDELEGRLAWRVPRVVPVALDPPSAIAGPLSLIGGRRQASRAGLAAIMLVAGGLLLAARFLGGVAPGGAVPSATPSPSAASSTAQATASAVPHASPTSTPQPSPSPSPQASPTASPSPRATASPSLPTPTRTYTVQSGDTLIGIAARFGTTKEVLQALNGITDPRFIRIGQVLKIP